MFHSELSKGDSLTIGKGLAVAMQRKNQDGSVQLTITAQPGASFTYQCGGETARVEVRDKPGDGCRSKLAIDAPRSVAITKTSKTDY